MGSFNLFFLAIFFVAVDPCFGQVSCDPLSSGYFLIGGSDERIYGGSTLDIAVTNELAVHGGITGNLAFDNRTNSVYCVDGERIGSYALDGCKDAFEFYNPALGTDVRITGLAIDEGLRRLYFNQQIKSQSPDIYTNKIGYMSLEDTNQQVTFIYEKTDQHDGSSGNEITIKSLKLDTSNQIIYWAFHNLLLAINSVFRGNIIGDTIENIKSIQDGDSSSVIQNIDIDLKASKIYWSFKGCKIERADIDDAGFGPIESHYDGPCLHTGASVSELIYISLAPAHNRIYYEQNGGVYEIPISGPSITPKEIATFGFVATDILFLPQCPYVIQKISFTSSQFITFEDNPTFKIAVQRTGSACFDPSINVINYGVSASRPADYSIMINGEDHSVDSVTVQFEYGQTIIEVPFTIHADDITEGNETFIVELANPSPHASVNLGDIVRTEVTIVDKSSYFEFEKATYDVMEGDGQISVTIKRVGYLGDEALVSMYTTGGTADADSDFNSIATDVLFEPYRPEASVMIDIKEDLMLEGTETFQVSILLNQPQGLSSTEIYIEDNEVGYSFEESSYEFNEYTGMVTIPVKRIGFSGVEGHVEVMIGNEEDVYDNRALKEYDYTESNPAIITFRAGQLIEYIYLHITDDIITEETESFQITISNPQPAGSDIDIATTTVSIVDNEVSFKDDSITAREGEILKIPIFRQATQEETKVLFTTCGVTGSAVEDEDFLPITSATVLFDAGQSTAFTPDLLIINDDQGEVNEAFRVVLTLPGQTSNPCSDEITNDLWVGIIDDDGLTYRFSMNNYRIQEHSTNLKVRVYQDGMSLNDNEESVILTVTSESATNNKDFSFRSPVTLNFGNRGYTDVLIQIVEDNEYEQGGETFNLMLTNSSGDILDTATVTIEDNDSPSTPQQQQVYYFRDVSLRVSESKKSVKIRVLRTDSSAPAFITLSTIPGSATESTDFEAINSLSLSFSVGSVYADQTIQIIDDQEQEEDETFQVFLSLPSDGGGIVGDSSRITVTITDDDVDHEDGREINGLGTSATIVIISAIVCLVIIVGVSVVIFFCIWHVKTRSAVLRKPPPPPVGFFVQNDRIALRL